MSEPGGRKPQATSRQDKVVCWALAQCMTWRTASTSSLTRRRLGVPPLTRSAHRDTAGGVDLFQRTESHWGWSRAGSGPCGASRTRKCTSLRLSSDKHEWDFEGGVGNKSKEAVQSRCPISSLKFSKCLRLLPSVLQHIFSKAWGLSQSKAACTEFPWKAEPCRCWAAAGLQTLDGTVWSKLQVLLSARQGERKSANTGQKGHTLWLKEGTLF